jgi:hypothetical protein
MLKGVGAMDGWEFEAPWGTALKLMSTAASLVLIAIPGFLLLDGSRPLPEMAAAVALPLVVLGGTLMYTVRGYSLSGDTLKVRRLFWNTRVDLAGLRSATVCPDAMKGAVRVFGNGGLFSFSGRFRSRRLGSFKAFVTDVSACVVLVTGRDTVVISPGSPERFAELASSLVHE